MSTDVIVTVGIFGDSYALPNNFLQTTPPLDLNFVSFEAASSNTVFEYSGRHDHGNLPTLKSSGTLAVLLKSLIQSKANCDRHFTDEINKHYGYNPEVGDTNEE